MENTLSFRKTDVLYSAILGGLIGALVPFIMTNLSARLPLQNFLFIIFAIMAPASLYIFYLLSAKTNSYFWNRFWTFQHKKTTNTKTEYAQFLVVSLIGFLVNITAFSLVFFFRPTGVSEALWGTIGVVCGTVAGLAVNFVGYKFFVFKK